MRFYGCQWGSLYASVHLWRGIKNPMNGEFTHVYVTNQRDLLMGQLGCPPGCLRCNMTGFCILCDNPSSKFLSNGSCYDKCPKSSRFYIPYISYYNNTEYTGNLCYETCPPEYFNPTPGIQGDPNLSIKCQKCF